MPNQELAVWTDWPGAPPAARRDAMSGDLADEQLALALQRGDARALAPLVERHHSPLTGFLYRMTNGDRALAEDLVQETFLRVARRVAQYRHPRPFKPWLYAIAVNLARDHFKSAPFRRSTALTDDVAGRTADAAPTPADLAQAAEDARRVAAAVQALPDGQRAAVVLRYYSDLSLAEIAETLAVPLGTVKSRLSLGLGRLRELLEAQV
jgi:RNA polymerase sigma-70 factor (ECF subfamily)